MDPLLIKIATFGGIMLFIWIFWKLVFKEMSEVGDFPNAGKIIFGALPEKVFREYDNNFPLGKKNERLNEKAPPFGQTSFDKWKKDNS